MITFLLYWVLPGIISTIVIAYVDWNNGKDIPMSDVVLVLFFCVLVGPISPILTIAAIFTDGNWVIKGRKR